MSEPDYFYTVCIGRAFGRRLEKLAADCNHEDVEAFAAMLLCRSIIEVEESLKQVSAPPVTLDGDNLPF